MQLAILIVLVLILIVLAPWLIPVAASLLAVYGVFFIVAITAAVVIVPLIFVFLWVIPRNKTASERLEDKNAAFNKRYLEEAKQEKTRQDRIDTAAVNTVEQVPASEKTLMLDPTPTALVTDEIICSRCALAFSNKHLVCPHCGKAPMPAQR